MHPLKKITILLWVMTNASAWGNSDIDQTRGAASDSYNDYFNRLMEKGGKVSRAEKRKLRNETILQAEKKYANALNKDIEAGKQETRRKKQADLQQLKRDFPNGRKFTASKQGAESNTKASSSSPAFQPPTREEIRLDGKGIKRNLEFGAKPTPTQTPPAAPASSGEVGIHGR